MPETDVVQLLTTDHRTVERLFERLNSGTGDRSQLTEELILELTIHAEAEERIVYPTIRSTIPDGGEKVAEAEQEHGEMKRLIAKLQELDLDDPAFESTLLELQEGVQHHVEEEESEVFPPFRDKTSADERARLGTQVLEAKQAAQGAASSAVSGRASADVGALTKEELYEQAKAADIPGRSKMTKDELARAVHRQA